jgi:hypothetical protein
MFSKIDFIKMLEFFTVNILGYVWWNIRSKSKDWLTRNQDDVSEWNDMSTHALLFQWTSTIIL